MRLTPELLELIAQRFKVIADPTRLSLLAALRADERTVSELIDATGQNQSNVSKQLAHLHAHGFVARRKEGLYTYYSLADKRVFQLCEIMCDGLQSMTAARRRTLAS